MTAEFDDILGRLSDDVFARLLMETKRFAETRWSPEMRRVDVTDELGTASALHLLKVRYGSGHKEPIHTSDGEGLGQGRQENHCEG